MRRIHTFRVPNQLILDCGLGLTARRMGAVLFAHRSNDGTCRKSLLELSKLCACAVTTAQTALEELVNAGYISRMRGYRYSARHRRVIYDKCSYLCNLDFARGFSLIPRTLFRVPLHSSGFVLFLFLYCKAGQGGRAFPSLTQIERELGIARSTVCKAKHELGEAQLVYTQACMKANRAFANNSYFFLCQTTGAAAWLALSHPVRARIRRRAIERLGVLIMRRRKSPRYGLIPMPDIGFSPSPQRWKPPFLWGSPKIGRPLLRLR